MRFALLTIVAVLSCSFPAAAQDTLPVEKLLALKRAAVFIKVEVGGRSFSGSGFVVHKDGPNAIVVTNLHVVEPTIVIERSQRDDDDNGIALVVQKRGPRGPIGPIRPMDGIPRPGGRFGPPPARTIFMTLKNAKITSVFDSGTKNERSGNSEVIAIDPDNDLAALRVGGVDNLPEPIGLAKLPELAETMPVYVFGYPFGKLLATSDRHPAITVGKAGISSLREDDAGDLSVVQIDGALNPGNSGGPIVDAKGQLVGVAVATIKNSSGIGLAIPAQRLAAMFAGRLGDVEIVPAENDKRLDVEVNRIDPLGKIKSASLYYLPAGKEKFDPKLKSLATMPGVKKIDLKLDKQLATARLPEGVNERQFLFQATFATAADKDASTRVTWMAARPQGPAVAPPNDPNPLRKDPAAVAVTPTRSGSRETRIVAGAFDARFRDDAPAGAVLVGFEIGLSRAKTVNALRPIYRTEAEESFGKQYGSAPKEPVVVRAKAGYVVAGVALKSGLTMEGMTLKFARMVDGKLDPFDFYHSDPIGSQLAATESHLGDDSPSVGIVGRFIGDEVTGLGLVLR